MSEQENSGQFLQAVYKNFHLLTFEDDIFYHFWKGDKNTVAKYFENFSFPKIKDLVGLMKMPQDIYVLISSNISKDEIYGSCILKINEKGQLQPITFVIAPNFRKKGHGTRLLAKLDELAMRLNKTELCIKYRTYWKSNQHWEKMLALAKWSEPEVVLHYFSLPDINTQFHKDWFKNSSLPHNYHVETWNDQSYETLKSLLKESDWKGVVPVELSPFQFPEKILPHVSLLLYKDQEIVGWLICHLLQPDIAHVTSLFTHPNTARGVGLQFVAEAAKRRDSGRRVVFMVKKDNSLVLHMIEKYADKDKLEVTQQYLRTKILVKNN